MKKGSKKADLLSFKHIIRKRYFLLILVHQKLVNLFHNPSTENTQALRFISILAMGSILLIAGGFNLHNNFVLLALLGATFIVLSVFLLNRDMENADIAKNSETGYREDEEKNPVLHSSRIKNEVSQ